MADKKVQEAIEKAEKLLEQQKHADAIPILEKLRKKEKENVQLLQLLGICYTMSEQVYYAIEIYEQLTRQLTPKDAKAFHALGMLYAKADRHLDAGFALLEAGKLDVNNIDYWYAAAVAYSKAVHFKEAIEILKRVLEIDPKHGPGLLLMANAYTQSFQDAPAIEVADRAVQASPKSAEAWATKGAVLARANRNPEAMACFEKAAELDPAFAAKLKQAKGEK